jgi:hypothetical protein
MKFPLSINTVSVQQIQCLARSSLYRKLGLYHVRCYESLL